MHIKRHFALFEITAGCELDLWLNYLRARDL